MSEMEKSGSTVKEEQKTEYNRYVKMTECYETALRNMPDSLDDVKEKLIKSSRKLEHDNDRIKTDIVNTPEEKGDGNEMFYSVLYRLNLSSDIDSCKKAAGMLKDYLSDNPGSVMGETMLKVIREQLED